MELAFVSNLGPAVAIGPVFVLPIVSILFAIGLRKVLRPSSSKFATIGAAFFGASFVELLVEGILAPSLPGGFFMYEPKGVTPDKELIAYCRIGERSSHTWFVSKYLLGYPSVRHYDGSQTEWGTS